MMRLRFLSTRSPSGAPGGPGGPKGGGPTDSDRPDAPGWPDEQGGAPSTPPIAKPLGNAKGDARSPAGSQAAARVPGPLAGGTLQAGKTAPEIVSAAQPFHGDGVKEGMNSLVMDNPGLNSGRGLGSNLAADAKAVPVRTSQTSGSGKDADRTDADIMLSVAAGDESGYTYLVTK